MEIFTITFIRFFCKWLFCCTVFVGLSGCEKESKDRTSLNPAAFAFINDIGPFEVHKILQNRALYVPVDCHRIWNGESPIGNFVTGNNVAVTLSSDVCDDWADDLVTLFQSYGYPSTADIFKAPGFTMSYVVGHSDYARTLDRASAYWQAPAGTRQCKDMPRAKQANFPELRVLGNMFTIWNWKEKGTPNKPANLEKGLQKLDPTAQAFFRASVKDAQEQGTLDLTKPHCVPGPR